MRENEDVQLFVQETFEKEAVDVLGCLQLGIDEKRSRNSCRGKAGYPVLEQDLPYLELKPFKCLAVGEVIHICPLLSLYMHAHIFTFFFLFLIF